MTQLQSLATGGAPLLLCNCSWLPSFPQLLHLPIPPTLGHSLLVSSSALLLIQLKDHSVDQSFLSSFAPLLLLSNIHRRQEIFQAIRHLPLVFACSGVGGTC